MKRPSMRRRMWNNAPKAAIDKEAIDEMEEEAGARYKMRERSKWQKKVECCIFEWRMQNGRRANPVPLPGWIDFQPGRTKKAFLLGAERKLRNAVRREKARYLHEREAQNHNGESAIVSDAAR